MDSKGSQATDKELASRILAANVAAIHPSSTVSQIESDQSDGHESCCIGTDAGSVLFGRPSAVHRTHERRGRAPR